MGQALLVLSSPNDREKAILWIRRAKWNSRITFRGPARTEGQNDRMWALLTHVSEQLVWDGHRHSTDDWKDYFMGLLNREKMMTAEDGGAPIQVGRSTSALDKETHGDLTMLIEAFAARQGVVIPEPEKEEA